MTDTDNTTRFLRAVLTNLERRQRKIDRIINDIDAFKIDTTRDLHIVNDNIKDIKNDIKEYMEDNEQ